MNALISKTRRALTTFLLLSAGIGGIQALHAQSLEYGFIQDPLDPQSVTAVFFPDFSRTSYTIPTAVFTFLVPADPLTGAAIATDPAFLDVPASNTIANRNGVWTMAQITPQTFTTFGLDPTVLEGFTVYQASLNPVISNTPDIVAGVPFELFNIRFPDDCPSSMIRMLVNDEPIQQFFINNLFINLNNTMSVAIDGNPTDEFYIGNQPGNDFIDCPILEPVELAAVKSVVDASGNGVAEPGEVLTYTISITNSGQAVADDVSVQDAVADPGITVDGTQALVIGGASDVLPANPTIADLQAGLTLDIAGGATATVSYSVTVTDPIADGDLSIDNLATVMDDGADVCASVDSDCDASIPTDPRVNSIKSVMDANGDGIAVAGEELTYTIILTNNGGSVANDVLVQDAFTDPNVEINNAQSLSIIGGSDIMPPIPTIGDLRGSGITVDIAPGETVSIMFTVVVADPLSATATQILNQAITDGMTSCPDGTVFIDGQPDINGDGVIDLNDDTDTNGLVDQNDCDPTVMPILNVALSKNIVSVEQLTSTVSQVTYDLLISNQGAVDVIYTLDDQLGYPSGANQINLLSGNVSTSDGVLEAGLASKDGNFTPVNNMSLQVSDFDVALPAGNSDSYQVVIRVAINSNAIGSSIACTGLPGSGFFNEAVIVGTVELDASDCEPISLDQVSMNLQKTNRQLTDNDGDGFGDVGEIIEYTFVIQNTGNVQTNSTRLIDRRLQSRDGTFTGCNVPVVIGAGEVTLINPMGPGDIVVCLGEYTITQEDIDNRRVTNTATLLASGSNGQNVTARASSVFSNVSESSEK